MTLTSPVWDTLLSGLLNTLKISNGTNAHFVRDGLIQTQICFVVIPVRYTSSVYAILHLRFPNPNFLSVIF
jgi:hypothetical protein